MTHPYTEFLHLLERPARYVGGEYASVTKSEARIRVALAFPDVYEIGMSHLGFKILYSILNRAEGIAAERVFAPWVDLEKELRARKVPLVSLESALPLSRFDVVGFSLQYEMTYTNILNMLELGGIPLRSSERGESDPLIVAGGPCAMSPEPLAPFIDVFAIGDGEELATELCEAWKRSRENGMSRRAALLELSKQKGLYVPSAYATEEDDRSGLEVVQGPLEEGSAFPVVRRIIEDINRFPFPSDSPVPFTEVVFDRLSVELARGCTEGCRFCQAGMIYRPVRERDPKEVIKTVLAGLKAGGYDEASLTCLSTADYSSVSPLLKELLGELKQRNATLGVSSLRAYGLGEDVLDDMAEGGVTGLTFAPEAGTQRMRDVISKNISEEEMITTARRVFERGWRKVKLYFMIGLPTETDEDVEGIIDISRRVAEAGRQASGKPVDVTVSVSSHVPKPHTPFQWAGMDSLDEIERKQDLLSRQARHHRLTFRKHNSRISRIEGLMSRGDRRMGDVLERAFQKGCRFDSWDDQFRYDLWLEALSEAAIDPERYLRPFPLDGRLPWGHIDVGVTEKFLATEYRRAVAGRLSPPCGKPVGMKVYSASVAEHDADERKLVCYHCGIACDMREMKTERREMLVKLDAFEPAIRRSSVPVVRGRRSAGTNSERPSEFVVRLTYAKLPPVSYVSHLDLIRMISRHFRRAGVEMAMTGGFHPRPDMIFGPALSLGTPSLGEMIDVRLSHAVDAGDLVTRLNQGSDTGLIYRSAETISSREKSISSAIVAAHYAVSLGSTENLAMIRSKVGSGTSIKIERERDGKKKQFELIEHLVGIEDLAEIDVWADADTWIPRPWARMTLKVAQEGSLRPGEAMSALLGGSPQAWRAVRIGFSLRAETGMERPLGKLPLNPLPPFRYAPKGTDLHVPRDEPRPLE